MVYAAVPAPSRRVEMWFDGPAQQRRWTVLIRFILAIPQAIVLGVLEIALIVVTIIGWFAAVVMGRVPSWVYQFNSGYVRWYTRYIAYAYLLTDQYPPFEFDDLPYPVRPIVAPPGGLNRLAVLFRIILVVPASFFQVIVSYGLFLPMLFVTWLIMVFTGRMPTSLYWAYSSWVRYGTRLACYMLLITSEYPWGMLGDRVPEGTSVYPPPVGPAAVSFGVLPAPDASPAPSPTTGVETAPSVDAESGAGEGGTASTEWVETPGGAGAAGSSAGAPAWPPPPPPGPPTWSQPLPQSAPPPWGPPPTPGLPSADAGRNRLMLPQGARKWLIFAIVWGSIALVGQISVQGVIAGRNLNTSIRQYNTVVDDFNHSRGAIDTAIADSQSCPSVQCLRASHLAAARSLERFDSDLKAMNLSCLANDPAQVVESDLTQMASAFTDLANSANAQAYRTTVQTSSLNTLLQSLPNDTNRLLNSMRSSNLGSVCVG